MADLVVEDVRKSYANHPVLQGVSLAVPSGSISAVVGPSGCGKTTLLRCIAGFEVPDTGHIAVGDTPVAGDGAWVPAHRRAVGYVAQDGALFPHLSVGQNVGFGLRRRDRSPERIAELLRTVALDPDYADRRPDQLSGGQQQRVSLARALALQPSVMLLDEPFSALDTGLRQRTRDVVGEVLRSAGITTVLVTHDQHEALSFADQVAVMSQGTFRQRGNPESVYLRPVDLDTARFLGDTVELPGEVAHGQLRCALGEFEEYAEHDGPVAVLLRPEQLTVIASDEPTPAQVTHTAFHGNRVRAHVQLDGSPEPLVLEVPAHTAPKDGSFVRVFVSGRPGVFPRSTASS